MALSAPVPGQKHRLYPARVAESGFGTAATITHYFNTLPMPPIRLSQQTVDDSELANGYDGPTQQIPLGRSVEHTVPLWASPEAIGLFCGFLCGSDTVSASFTPSIVHSLIPTAPGTAAYGMTLEDHLSSSSADDETDWKHLGMVVKAVTLSGGRDGFVRADIELMGSGGAANGSSRDESTLATRSYFFPAAKAKISMKPEQSEGATAWGGTFTAPTSAGVFANTLTGGSPAAFDLSQHLESWSIRLEAEYRADRSSGNSSGVGVIGSQPYVFRRRGSAQLKWIVDATTKALTKALYNSTAVNNAAYTLALELVGDVAAGGGGKIVDVLVVLPLVKFDDTPQGDGSVTEFAQDTANFKTHNQTSGTNYGHYRVFVCDGQTGVYCAA